MNEIKELRQSFQCLVEKTRGFVEAQQKAHKNGRTMVSTVLENGSAAGEPKPAPKALAGLKAGLSEGPSPRPPFAGELEEFEAQICQCLRCPLGATRKSFVFGGGDPKARLVFIGEAPGAEEDAQGLAFVGAAGALLTKIISAMGFTRQKVYICNLLKCRPPLNRDPKPEEAAACRPYLEHQLKLIQPKILVTLGNHATHALIGRENEGISRLRGARYEWQGLAVYPTYHPSALLHNETLKKYVWDDMKLVLKELGARLTS